MVRRIASLNPWVVARQFLGLVAREAKHVHQVSKKCGLPRRSPAKVLTAALARIIVCCQFLGWSPVSGVVQLYSPLYLVYKPVAPLNRGRHCTFSVLGLLPASSWVWSPFHTFTTVSKATAGLCGYSTKPIKARGHSR